MNIAVFAVNNSFVMPIIQELTRYHQVEPYIPTGDKHLDFASLRGLVDWSDLVFCDFCHYPLPELTHMGGMHKPIVGRMHGIEVYRAAAVDWRKVQALILTEPMKQKFMATEVPHRPPMHILPIGFNTKMFDLTPNKEYGKNICMQATSIFFKKRVYTTAQTFYELRKRDPEWKLFIKGDWTHQWRGELVVEYVNPLRELFEILDIQDDVIVSQQDKLEDWTKWLDDKDIYLSNSIQEGFQKSLAEAMGKGVFPVINCWLGADTFYPEENIVKTQTEMVEKVLWWSEQNDSEKRKLSRSLSKYVRSRYDERKVARDIRKIIEEVEELGKSNSDRS